jgi:tRNA pseudouridine38-40 synthase
LIYILEIAYKGTNYHGWQIQKNAHTVQEELNNAIASLLSEPVDTLGSGRTDTGVHAEQQFLQFETVIKFDPEKFLFQVNSILPKDIFVKHIFYAYTYFNVRHNATKRSYEYRISRWKNPFLNDICFFYYPRNLNVGLMNKAAKTLTRHIDFQSFSKYKTAVEHFECTIFEAYWQEKNGLLIFHITANRFLRGMVRAIVGTLLEVGLGKIDIEKFEQIILAKDRKAAKHAAPPEGLFLTNIKYPRSMLKLLA